VYAAIAVTRMIVANYDKIGTASPAVRHIDQISSRHRF
jgi:hypothetical protein